MITKSDFLEAAAHTKAFIHGYLTGASCDTNSLKKALTNYFEEIQEEDVWQAYLIHLDMMKEQHGT